MKLYIFHHAGGSAYAYNDFSRALPSEIEVKLMEMSGRGRKMNQPLNTDARVVARQFFEQMKDELNRPYAILGHSLGGLIGSLVIKEIAKAELPSPKIFFISAAKAPSTLGKAKNHLLPSHEFWEMLRNIGGMSEEIINDQGLRELFEPIIRADFEVIETYRHIAEKPLDLPMVAIAGEDDTLTAEAMMLWQEETTRKLEMHILPGNHFYILNQFRPVINIISEKLAQWTKTQIGA